MAIQFYCPGCGNLMRTPDETAGRKGRCPNCGLKIQIPTESLASGESEGLVVEDAEPHAVEEAKIEFYCSHCGRQVRVAAAAAGQRGKCPGCQAVVQIPDLPSDQDTT